MKKLTIAVTVIALALGACSTEKTRNRAKEAAAKYWQDKAYPGKNYDVQVTDAEKAEDGMYRVKGIVDGETRVGMFNPETENFSEGFYSLAHERSKRIAELEQESRYWKEKAEGLEKENYKLKVRLKMASGKKLDDEDAAEDAATKKQ
jgi:hypothetical protein